MITFKVVSFVSALTLCSTMFGSQPALTTGSSMSDATFVTKAIKNFKKVIAQQTGKFYRLSCKFKLCGNHKMQTVTRGYFSDYHKQSCCFVDGVQSANKKPTTVAEVIFNKSEPGQLALILNGRNQDVKYLPLSIDLFAQSA